MTDAPPPAPGEPADVAADEDAAHERRRRRAPRRVGAVGAALAVLAAVASGVAGMPGQVGTAVLLTVLSGTSAVAGATVAIGIVLDQYNGRRVSGARVAMTGAFFIGTVVLLAASAGAFTAAAEVTS